VKDKTSRCQHFRHQTCGGEPLYPKDA